MGVESAMAVYWRLLSQGHMPCERACEQARILYEQALSEKEKTRIEQMETVGTGRRRYRITFRALGHTDRFVTLLAEMAASGGDINLSVTVGNKKDRTEAWRDIDAFRKSILVQIARQARRRT